MIYKIFWYLANIAIRVFYGKIEVSGLDNVPKDGPVLIASNHPNGFLEPITMACIFPRPLHFMVRGDLFRKKPMRFLMENTNQIPIFRFKDGFKELRKNDSNLQIANKVLDDEGAILIFIEGGTQAVKTLRPFQKGLARMALTYLESTSSDKPLQVLPVSINFVSPFTLRSRVSLNVGKPFEAAEYFKDEETKVQDTRRLTSDLYEMMLPLAYNVQSADRQEVLNHTLRLGEGLFTMDFCPMVSDRSTYWPTLKSISDRINEMSDDVFTVFATEAKAIRDTKEYEVKRTGKSKIWAYLATVLFFCPAMIGLALNIIPGAYAQYLPKKVLSKDKTVFIGSIILSSGVAFYPVYYIVVILVLSVFYGVYGLLFLFAWPLGFLYLWWKNNYRSSFGRSKYYLADNEVDQVKALFEKYNIDMKNTAV